MCMKKSQINFFAKMADWAPSFFCTRTCVDIFVQRIMNSLLVWVDRELWQFPHRAALSAQASIDQVKHFFDKHFWCALADEPRQLFFIFRSLLLRLLPLSRALLSLESLLCARVNSSWLFWAHHKSVYWAVDFGCNFKLTCPKKRRET